MTGTVDYDAVVLAGGRARRLGGVDKAGLVVGGRSLLDRSLAAVADARAVVAVGPLRETAAADVTWVREEPPGAGPLAALGAGLAALPSPVAPVVVVLAADLPYVTPAVVQRLLDELARTGADAACLVDGGGQRQLLTAAYRSRPLAGALARTGLLADQPLRPVLGSLATTQVRDPTAARDVDTPDDLAAARAELEP